MRAQWILFLVTAGPIFALKAAMLLRRGAVAGWPAFLFAWPGIIPDHFRQRRSGQQIDAPRFFGAWARMLGGALLAGAVAVTASRLPEPVLGMAGILALLLAVHLGIADLLPWLLRWTGFATPLLFDRPWAARSLTEFWSKRWNLAFVEMNCRLFLRPLHRALGERGSRLALFAISGLLHEVGLSLPAGGGWGLPLGYFLLQGALVEVEKRFGITSRIWTWFWLLLPSPWLFHQQFRHALIVPFYQWLHGLLTARDLEWYLSVALYTAVVGHMIVLCGGLQAPARLGWREDFSKLKRFNQKIFWVYSFYIVFCILAFALLTWQLHDEMVAGERTARWAAGFMAVFWTVRVLADVLWYDHRDWPPGNALVVGHAMLTSLFCALAGTYWFVLALPRA